MTTNIPPFAYLDGGLFSFHKVDQPKNISTMNKNLELRANMEFQIGDKVIHSTYGLGEIKAIENRTIHKRSVSCYEVRTSNLTIWVPFDNGATASIRAPASKNTFESLLSVLQDPNEPLLDNHLERKKQLQERMRDGELISIFRVVRDLSNYGYENKLNISDKSILDRATETLLIEWVYSLLFPYLRRENKLDAMLKTA